VYIPVLNLTSHHQEGLLDVRGSLRGSLNELNAELSGILRSLVEIHLTLLYKIAFVANKQLIYILIRIAIDFVKPLLHVVERLQIGHIVDHNNAVCSTIVAGSNCAEAFLSSSVPDLQLNGLTIEIERPDFLNYRQIADQIEISYEIDTNGGNVAVGISVILIK